MYGGSSSYRNIPRATASSRVTFESPGRYGRVSTSRDVYAGGSRPFASTVTGSSRAPSRPRTYVSEPPTRPGNSVRRAKPACRGSSRGGGEALDRPAQPFLQRHLRLEAHQLAGARHVEVARRLAVGVGVVPHDLALEPAELVDRLGEVADARLHARPDVHRLRRIELLGGKDHRPRGVVAVEELAGRAARAPQRHVLLAAVARLHELADHRGDHVRVLEIEVVLRPVEVGHHGHAGVEVVLAP